jgi:hypothetical protein
MIRVTFTVDEETVATLRQVSARLKKPQSVVLREAIKDYAERADRLSDEERDRLLAHLKKMRARKPTRTQAEVDAEIADIRAARRTGGRQTPVE